MPTDLRYAPTEGQMQQIREWKSQQAEIQAKINALNQELSEINKRLEAANTLWAPHMQDEALRDSLGMPPVEEKGSDRNMMEAVPRILSAAGGPLTKSQLRHRLHQEGFAAGQLTNYFYTVIMRLRQRNVLIDLPDGKVTLRALL